MLLLTYLLYFTAFFIWFKLFFNLISTAKERLFEAAPKKKWLSFVAQLKAAYLPEAFQKRLVVKLTQAGLAKTINVDDFIALKLISALVGLVLLLIIRFFKGIPIPATLFYLPITAFCFFWLPDAWLNQRAATRCRAIKHSLPDFIDLLTICVEAGLGLDGAIARIAAEAQGPLAEEMRRLLSEVQFGQSRKEAWHNLAERLQLTQINSLALAVTQAELFGVSIAKVLRVQSEQLRLQWRQQVEEQAMKMPTKLVFPLVLCIFPALILIILGPAAINIYHTFTLRP